MKLSPAIVRGFVAITAAIVCHVLFLVAVASMAFALATGMQQGLLCLPWPWAASWNLLLVLQFPLLHSFLLTARGRRVLDHCWPAAMAKTLRPTTYASLASLQLLATFWLWSPTGIVWSEPHGASGAVHLLLFAAAWLFLQKSLWDAGLMLQTGAAGWWALLRDRQVDYGAMPSGGTFRLCRQPIYLGFALVLVTAPVWSLDWLALTMGWSLYCIFGPRRKEARWARIFSQDFERYRATVPYFLPRLRANRSQR